MLCRIKRKEALDLLWIVMQKVLGLVVIKNFIFF